MKLVDSWLGRCTAPFLLTLLVVSTSQATTLANTSGVDDFAGVASGQTSSSAPIPAQTAPQTTQAPEKQSVPPPATQTTPAPVVRQTPPATTTQRTTQPGKVPAPDPQQFTKDEQFNTPAATQQLVTHTAGQPAATPAATQPSAPPPAPVGTAVAPEIKGRGVPGSKVAGAAIAPSKQRRIRVFAIRAALLVGAAVAIGVVAGASKASPAQAHPAQTQ